MKPSVAAIGTFDGVHRGHLAVIDKLKEVASDNGLEPVVITFDSHPLSIIAPQRAPAAITSVEKKQDLLKKAGVRPVILHFDEAMRKITARDWMRRLHKEYGVKVLVVGYDNTFGSDGITLSIADYKRIGKEVGVEVVEAPFVKGISSSAIRKDLVAGKVEEASSMLGRNFSLPGNVVSGNHLGRTIGFPTANLIPQPGLTIPANGVYVATALLPDGSTYPAIINIGTRPTVRRGDQRTIEAHIIGFDGDLYGRRLILNFYKRLRDEKRFNSIEALRTQIEKDKEAAKLFLQDVIKSRK